MKKETRSQRRAIYRQNRVKRAVENMNAKTGRKKINITNIITIFLIVMVFFVLKTSRIFEVSYSNKVLFSVEGFKSAYETFIKNNESKFDYDKNIESIVNKGNDKLSYVQKSTKDTNNYILLGVDDKNNIVYVSASGKYEEDNLDFPVGFKENILTVTALVLKTDYNKAQDYLINSGLFNKDGNLYLAKKELHINNHKVIFSIDGDNFNYTITKENKIEGL